MYSLKLYKFNFHVILFILLGLATSFLNASNHSDSSHHDKESQHNLELGLFLEKKFWMSVQKKKIEKTSKMLASAFQSLNPNGIQNKKQQIEQLVAANLLGFGFNHPKATRKGNTLVFSYDLLAIGNGVVSGPQITVWKKLRSGWKIISRSEEPFLPVIARR